jgi:RNA polymerase sigma-70 factor, ECF subfamily
VNDLTALLQAARAGDEASFAAWVRRTQADVWRLCVHLVDLQAADDLTQETYVRAWRALPDFRGDASARTWLLSIARRTCADAIRSRVRRRRLRDRLSQRTVVAPKADEAEHITLTAVIAQLAPARREAFTLTQVLGLSYADAAAICGCPIGTIRSRVARARADLIAAIALDTHDGAEAPPVGSSSGARPPG